MFEAAQRIGTFKSWTQVSKAIIETAAELETQCKGKTLAERRQFVYGGLVALNVAYGWDMESQSEETEQLILWMFTQLYVR